VGGGQLRDLAFFVMRLGGLLLLRCTRPGDWQAL
jgi:hypothetical protein